MKKLFLVSIAICASTTFAQAAPAENSVASKSSCTNLTGTYQLPLQKDERSNNSSVLIIDQDQCRLINITAASGGVIPISPDHALDGSEGYYIVGDSIVRKAPQGYSFSLSTEHGLCESQNVARSLDENKNLIVSSKRIYSCADKYQGPYREVLTRIEAQLKLSAFVSTDICEANGDCNGGRCTAAGVCENGGTGSPCNSGSQCASAYCYAGGTCR